MGDRARWTITALALASLAAVIAVVETRARRAASRPVVIAPAPGAASRDAPAPAPPDSPKRVRRDSVRVPLYTGNPRESFWQMHEAEPLVAPDDEPRPITLLLHGMCADSSWTCDWLQYFEMKPQWQVCPRAPSKCGGEPGYRWAGVVDIRRVVELSIATLKARHDARVRDDSLVLAGFSLGAYAVAALVRDLARQPSASLRVVGILAQGARVHFSAADVRQLGARIALTAGDLDSAAPAMRAEVEQLRREGIDARYVSLGGDEGHFSSVSTGKTVAALIDWCRGE
jgi:predicted esterase